MYRFTWRKSKLKRLTLVAEFVDEEIINYESKDIFDEIGEWCLQNNCGRRTAYCMFKFPNRKKLDWFLLRWS
jgi:hypothetical protein